MIVTAFFLGLVCGTLIGVFLTVIVNASGFSDDGHP